MSDKTIDDSRARRELHEQIDGLLRQLVAHQEARVLTFARRLKPGLTAEDVRNAHDFRELDDPDFHYEDGMLAGLHSALTAVRAQRRESEAPQGEGPGT